MDFKELYTFSAKKAVYTPVIIRAGIGSMDDLPYQEQKRMALRGETFCCV